MSMSILKPYGATPSQRQIKHFREYGKKAFFHFGVNTFSNLEWGNGNETEAIFNPTDTDVKQWIRVVKDAGFTLAILTVKHHDGFCLWPSEHTGHSIKNSPYKDGKGDILREFVDACHEYGVAVGIYMSPWDRNNELWGTAEYSKYYNKQLTEVLTNYGKIDEVWWDGAGSTETVYDWGLWAYTVRNLQPDAVIFGSFGATPYTECRWIGNEAGISHDPHYPTIKTEHLEKEITSELNSGNFDGDRFVIAEADMSIRPGWFYHKHQDDFVKTPKQLIDLWFNSVGNSALMLLNFPPDRRGLVYDTDAKNALEAHKIITKALSVNLADEATVSSSSVREGFPAQNIIESDYNKVFASSDSDINPVIEIDLCEKKRFDTIILGEYVELGIRVCGYKVEALCDGKWKLIADKKSIGYKKAVHFEPIEAEKIKLSIYKAVAAPILREFGLYNFRDNGYNANEQRPPRTKTTDIVAENPGASFEYSEDGATVMLGGLYPFNTIKFNGENIRDFEIMVFDGLQFYSAFKGTSDGKEVTVCFDDAEIAAYQFKIVTNCKTDSSMNIRVYSN